MRAWGPRGGGAPAGPNYRGLRPEKLSAWRSRYDEEPPRIVIVRAAGYPGGICPTRGRPVTEHRGGVHPRTTRSPQPSNISQLRVARAPTGSFTIDPAPSVSIERRSTGSRTAITRSTACTTSVRAGSRIGIATSRLTTRTSDVRRHGANSTRPEGRSPVPEKVAARTCLTRPMPGLREGARGYG